MNRLLLHGARYHDRKAVFVSRELGEMPDWRADRLSIRVALALREDLAGGPGDVVALSMPLSIRWALVERAVWGLGAATLPVSPDFRFGRPVKALFASSADGLSNLGVPGVALDSDWDALLDRGGVLDTPEHPSSFRAAARNTPPEAVSSTIRYGRGAVLTLDLTNRCNMMFDAKRLAIDRIFEAGMDVTPVTTVVNTVNDGQVGPILDFVIDHSDVIGAISFQPVSFTGRDEDISDVDRRRMRYTVSHLAHGLSRYYDGKIDVYRDWYPLGSLGAFTWLADHLRGPDTAFGGLNCSCHPNCGASTILVVNWQTRAWTPLTAFFDVEGFLRDVNVITDTARGVSLSKIQALLAFIRNLNSRMMPGGLTVPKFLKLVNRKMGGTMSSSGSSREEDEWNIVWVGGMWFQDLWTYDFRRTEMCVIPYATQEGEISFCAYNTGVGWRKIVENMHMVAETRDWFQKKGRHSIYAGNRTMPLGPLGPLGPEEIPLPVVQGGGVTRHKTAPHAGTMQLASSGCGCHGD